MALFQILSSQRVLLTSFSAESIYQEVLVEVLLTDYHVTTCNKCNVIKDVDGRLVITMTLTIAIYEFTKSSILMLTSHLFILISVLLSIEHIC